MKSTRYFNLTNYLVRVCKFDIVNVFILNNTMNTVGLCRTVQEVLIFLCSSATVKNKNICL